MLALILLGEPLIGSVSAHQGSHDPGPARYTVRKTDVVPPSVTLIGMDEQAIALVHALRKPGAVFVNFVYSTCTAICPAQAAAFASAQRLLKKRGIDAQFISITLDPEHDNPATLRAFAEQYRAQPGWLFLTGAPADIVSSQRAFDAYVGNKARHIPLAFLRANADDSWLRIEGVVTGKQLVEEYLRASN